MRLESAGGGGGAVDGARSTLDGVEMDINEHRLMK